jgi:uncharacterized protein
LKLKTQDDAFDLGRRTPRAPSTQVSPAKAKIWIDMDNSPHVPFFAPIAEELENRGYSVILTARDCFQVRELADFLHLNYKLIGRHSGKNKLRKLVGLCLRALQLAPVRMRERPDLAVSICSRSQLILAALTGIPAVFMGDYEHAKGWAVIRPAWLVCPEVMPAERMGVPSNRILKYGGIKEDVYVPKFVPERSMLPQLGLQEQDIVVTLRPPAREAHYHVPATDGLFDAAVEFLSLSHEVKLVVLPRNKNQAEELKTRWFGLFSKGTMLIPDRIVNGLSLIWDSDLVISAGGTMNREAAALGVPVYSVFRGKLASVDRYLARQGRLVLIGSPEDIRTKVILAKRPRAARPTNGAHAILQTVVEHIISIAEREITSPGIKESCIPDRVVAGHRNQASEFNRPGSTE